MIKNNPTIVGDKHIDELRGWIEIRANWLFYLVQEAQKRGLDLQFAYDAIHACGDRQRESKPKTNSVTTFCQSCFSESVTRIFEQDVEYGEDEVNVTFHYCPLVAAWRKLTDDEELISKLCDIAMEGDRAQFSQFDFYLGDTIAAGKDSCKMCVSKKKK